MDDTTEDTSHVHVSARGSRCPCRPIQRRSHTKSRNGCSNCKRRRVKCDEGRPACVNCSRCSLPCDFDTGQTNILISPTKSPRKRGRPMKTWTLSPTNIASVKPDSSSVEPSHSLPHLNVEDLQLYHHYMTKASRILGDDTLWNEKVPLLAFENHYVLHLLLALSALHQARQRPCDADRLERYATEHHDKALREVTGLLPQINKSNCSALYIATVLIFSYTLARSPSTVHLRVNATRSEITWLTLFRGIRFTIETMGLSAIFSGYLGPFPPENDTHVPPSKAEEGYISWEEALTDLGQFISPMQESGLEALYDALLDCFHEVYGTAQQPNASTNGKVRVVMRWLWIIEDDFIQRVDQAEPRALILLAHFAVLLRTIDCFWYMTGWARRVMDDVIENLEPCYIDWISWPREQIVS